MKEGKTGQCIHRITAFQAHRGCQELAAICEKNCQEPHKADDDRILISVEAVEEQLAVGTAVHVAELAVAH